VTYLAIDRQQRESSRSWEWVPFGRVARLRREPNRSRSLRLLSLSASTGIDYRTDDGGRQLPSEGTVVDYWRVSPRDLVFNPMWAFQGGLAVSGIEGAVSPAYRVYELSERLHPQFIHYFLRSAPALEQYGLLIRGITTFDRSITREDFEGMPVPVPSLDEQQVIADFLDRETARIEALISKRRNLLRLLGERLWHGFVARVQVSSPPLVPLRRALISMIDGPFGSAFKADSYSDSGARVVRLGNIGYAQYRGESEAFIPLDLYGSLERYRVLEGDLLIASLGDEGNHAGRACVAPDLGLAIVKGKCLRARVDGRRAIAEYLALVLSSPLGAQAVALSTRGSTRTMVNVDVMKNVSVPLPSMGEQRAIVEWTRGYRARVGAARSRLDRQVGLLEERRQALISAAVTGRMSESRIFA
jgi:type I restriction enzyme S subunit